MQKLKGYRRVFSDVSGETSDFFAFAIRRWAGIRPHPETMEIFFFVYDHGQITQLFRVEGIFGNIWCSPNNEIHIFIPNQIIKFQNTEGVWTKTVTPQKGNYLDIWGKHKDEAFVWGLKDMSYWNGDSWKEISLPKQIYAMHGAERGTTTAVGYLGSIFRWDGAQWQQMQSPTSQDLVGVQIIDRDKMYIVGKPGYVSGYVGSVFEQTKDRWTKILDTKEQIRAIAKIGKKIFVLDEKNKIYIIEEGKLMQFNDLRGFKFECRKDLFVISTDRIQISSNGETFKTIQLSEILNLDSKNEQK
ncbi:hypothetical protein HY990_04055 [Candidatus Micrarchaeota archaeon]|nr:hypothetical protein [Candidatus Micrarchaeota archaeon]